ncbi:MAG: hypothetical protein ACYDGR_07975 [Candidatus Dormibacteria bacterium]
MTRITAPGRLIVVATTVGTALLALPAPSRLNGYGLLIIALLTGLDFALVGRTRGLGFRPTRGLDERLRQVRDRAYRIAFRLVGLGLVLTIAVRVLPIFPMLVEQASQRDTLGDGISPRVLFAVLEMLVFTPSMVLSWTGFDPAPGRWARHQSLAAASSGFAGPALVAVAVVVAWVTLISAGTPRSSTTNQTPDRDTSVDGATCAHFVSRRDVGYGLGGVVRARAEACWNGKVAFLFGAGPSLPAPAGAPQYFSDPLLPDLMGCGLDTDQQDLVAIRGTSCSASIDSAGTLHYRAWGHLFPGPLPFAGREIRVELIIDRNGRVISFG